ncbi:hypothetical protein [Sphingorhabdus sp.]|uniref:hypothetical protein n=1 Tax=Sphingorhabdus sp. TaxID=1902408 RepID=UPI0038FC6DC7
MTVIAKVDTQFPINVQTEAYKDSFRSPSFPIAASRLSDLATIDTSIPPATFSASPRTEIKEASVDEAISNLAVAQDLEERYGVNVLTNEGRLLTLIKSAPNRSLKFYLTSSGLSYRWFSITVEKLLKSGLIEKLNCQNDERSRTLR